MSNNVGIDFTELGPPHGTTAQNQPPQKNRVIEMKQDESNNNRISGQTEGKGNHSGLC